MSFEVRPGRRLALTHLTVPEGPLPDDLVLLGVWCAADRVELSGNDLSNAVIRHPWLDGARLESDYETIRGLYERALGSLASQLNARHGVDLSLRGWEIALGPWLRIFLNCVFERYMLLDEAVRARGVAKVLTIEPWFERTAHTTAQFVRALQDARWNEMFGADVAAQMFGQLERETVASRAAAADGPAGKAVARRSMRKRLAGRVKALVTAADEIASRRCKVLLHRTGMQWREELKLMLKLGLVPHMYLPALEDRAGAADATARAGLSLGLGSSGFEQVLERMVRLYLPRIFLEDFQAARTLIEERYPRRAKLIVTGVAYYVDDCFKLYTAFATDAGVKYTILQHGGGFGTPKINDEEELLIRTADEFLTWGWSENTGEGHAKTVPGASLWLSSLRDVAPDPAGTLLMPVSEWTLQTFRLFSAPLSFRQLDYLDDIVRFYRQLEPTLAERFRLRLQPNTRGWRVAERIEAAGLGHAVLRGPGRFVQDLKAARLAVVNTNSTTLLEALSLNFPTLAIIDPQMSGVRAQVRDAYDALERAGIAYSTPEAAAAFAARIFANPMAWWENPQVQSARTSFVQRFARRDPMFLRSFSQSLSLTR